MCEERKAKIIRIMAAEIDELQFFKDKFVLSETAKNQANELLVDADKTITAKDAEINYAIDKVDNYYRNVGIAFVSESTLKDRIDSILNALDGKSNTIADANVEIEGLKEDYDNMHDSYACMAQEASKLRAEKNKLLALIKQHVKPNREGTLDPKKLLTDYKAWQKEKNKKA